jgi:hypothetical protein
MTMNATLPARLRSASALRAVVLLAGHAGPSPFADAIGRSVLDLPVDARRTLFDVWVRHFDDVAESLGTGGISVLVSIDRTSPKPLLRPRGDHPRVVRSVVRDRAEYRGTAGVVRDVAGRFRDDDRILVMAAGLVQREPLRDVVAELLCAGEGVSVVPFDGGEIATAFLLRCDRLRSVPEIGFVDLKEQAIPSAGCSAALSVVRRPEGSAVPVRTAAEYVRALRTGGDVAACVEDAYAETWEPRFGFAESGARVDSGAVLLDSVVLAGGRVEAGAVVARSVVCGGGVVRRGACVVEAVVTA